LVEAVDLPIEYEADGRAGMIIALLLREIQEVAMQPVQLLFPNDERLAEHCRQFLEKPTPHATIDDWSHSLGKSRRAFTRQFRNQTGLSFASWRRRASLLVAIPRLEASERVTDIAFDLGYASPAAFTSMFKRVLGAPPSGYRRACG